MNIATTLPLVLFFCWANGTSVEELSSSNNVFTAALYKELLKTNQGNILISPLAIEIALALSQSGARNQTAEEIRNALHLPKSDEDVQKIFKNVLQVLGDDGNFTLLAANKIYVKDTFTLQEQFEKVAEEVFQAETENIDFTQKTEAASLMNKWVENKTDNKIHNLIDPEILDEKTVAILINALLFKGQWVLGFDSGNTQKQNFSKTVEDVVEVDMMYQVQNFHYYYKDNVLKAQFLKMPFFGEDISMVFVLPDETDGITKLEKQIEKVFAPHEFKENFFPVYLPKFKVEIAIDLKDVLKNLGIKLAFDELKADFSGVINEEKKICISHVKQKTYISVDEKGVEAAAATFQAWQYLANPSVKFVADHPFIFYIKFKDLILFAGKFSEPGQ